MVKSARLESEWAGNRPVSSNLTLSAILFIWVCPSGRGALGRGGPGRGEVAELV